MTTAAEPSSKEQSAVGADRFAEYYEHESLSPRTVARFRATKDAILRVRRKLGLSAEKLDVADIGCGAATQCIMWASEGHNVCGMDVNESLIEMGRRRAIDANLPIRLDVGTATQLPWRTGSMDVCLLPELLEHVTEWRECLAEAARVLRPNGLLYISTTNRLCPRQDEFDLPLYSWYPARLKRHCEKLATTTHPQWVSHAQYPAVNWFDYFSLVRAPELRDFECLDRFDAMDTNNKSAAVRLALKVVRGNGALRWLAHVATSYTMVFAVRRS